jgi:hypothetical protein
MILLKSYGVFYWRREKELIVTNYWTGTICNTFLLQNLIHAFIIAQIFFTHDKEEYHA